MLYSIMVLHIITMPRITQKAIGVLFISIVVLYRIILDHSHYKNLFSIGGGHSVSGQPLGKSFFNNSLSTVG